MCLIFSTFFSFFFCRGRILLFSLYYSISLLSLYSKAEVKLCMYDLVCFNFSIFINLSARLTWIRRSTFVFSFRWFFPSWICFPRQRLSCVCSDLLHFPHLYLPVHLSLLWIHWGVFLFSFHYSFSLMNFSSTAEAKLCMITLICFVFLHLLVAFIHSHYPDQMK